MQSYRIIEGFIGELACIKVISAGNIIVDIAFKRSATYARELTEIRRKYNID